MLSNNSRILYIILIKMNVSQKLDIRNVYIPQLVRANRFSMLATLSPNHWNCMDLLLELECDLETMPGHLYPRRLLSLMAVSFRLRIWCPPSTTCPQVGELPSQVPLLHWNSCCIFHRLYRKLLWFKHIKKKIVSSSVKVMMQKQP